MRKNQELFNRVEFRWRQHEELFAERLAEEARKFGRTQSDHARELLKNALTASDETRQAVESLQQDVALLIELVRPVPNAIWMLDENVHEFRNHHATGLVKTLMDAGKLTAETAEQWVKDTLNAE